MTEILDNNSNSPVSPVPLNEWTKHAAQSIDISNQNHTQHYNTFISSFGEDSSTWPIEIRKSLSVSSDGFVTAALGVARSLGKSFLLSSPLKNICEMKFSGRV